MHSRSLSRRLQLVDRRLWPLPSALTAVLVVGELLGEPGDLLLLLNDELLELRGPAATVVSLDAGAAAVVAGSAGRDEVRRLPEQLRRLRARDLVMDGRRVAPTMGPADHALVTVAGEHGFAEPLPSRRRVAPVAHSSTADGSRRSCQTPVALDELDVGVGDHRPAFRLEA
jgi:hypothetical protein